MAMCPWQHKRDILAQTSSGGEVLIFHNPRLAHRRKPWLLVTLQNVSRLQGEEAHLATSQFGGMRVKSRPATVPHRGRALWNVSIAWASATGRPSICIIR